MNFADCKHLGRHNKKAFPDDVELGLGDYTALALTKIGVTKERFSELVNLFNEEGKECNCPKRHKFLNWMGEKLGMPHGQGSELQEAIASFTFTSQPMYECALHETCIGRGNYEPAINQAIKDAGIMPCQICETFEKGD